MARGRREPERRAVVVVTPEAAARVRAAAAGAGFGRWYVRVRVDVTRFDGLIPAEFQNRVDIDTVVDPEADYLDESQGVPVAVDRRTARYVEGVVLDWTTRPDGTAGFALLPAAR